MKKLLWVLIFAVVALWATTTSAQIVPTYPLGIHGPFLDGDDNGSPDVGVTVSGSYTAFWAWDWYGHSAQDFGNGYYGDDLADFDKTTKSVCDFLIIYNGEFNNDPILDSGWIMQKMRCHGYDYHPGVYIFQAMVVDESDPRYTGTGIPYRPGWEFYLQVESGGGNIFED